MLLINKKGIVSIYNQYKGTLLSADRRHFYCETEPRGII